MVLKTVVRQTSLRLVLSFWLFFAFALHSIYSSNLNAYLVAIDYERAIDTEKDILHLERDLYLPLSSALYTAVATSPLAIHQTLLRGTLAANKLYNVYRGWITRQTEMDIIDTGIQRSEDGKCLVQ